MTYKERMNKLGEDRWVQTSFQGHKDCCMLTHSRTRNSIVKFEEGWNEFCSKMNSTKGYWGPGVLGRLSSHCLWGSCRKKSILPPENTKVWIFVSTNRPQTGPGPYVNIGLYINIEKDPNKGVSDKEILSAWHILDTIFPLFISFPQYHPSPEGSSNTAALDNKGIWYTLPSLFKRSINTPVTKASSLLNWRNGPILSKSVSTDIE